MLSNDLNNTALYISALHQTAVAGQDIVFSTVALRQLTEILEQAARDAAALERNIAPRPVSETSDNTNVIRFPERETSHAE